MRSMKAGLKFFFATFFALVGALLSSCNDDPSGDGNSEQVIASSIRLSQEQKTVSKRNLEFSNELFNATSQKKENENFVISPLGAYLVLSMIANGVEGNTLDEILKALRIENGEIDCLNSLNKLLLEKLPVNTACDINIKNSFWYNPEKIPALYPEFTEALTNSYQASMFAVTSEELAPKVNQWVAQQTQQGISNFIKENEIQDFGCAFLNTLDFSGVWQKQNGLPSSLKNFYNVNGDTKEMTFLESDNASAAWSTGKCYVVDLMYRGYGCRFRIIYPYEGVNMEEALSTYKEFVDDPYKEYGYQYGKEKLNFNIFFPKFMMESTVNLIPILKQMGIKDLFDKDNCKFTKITSNSHGYLNLFKQYTKVKVDEKGTKAQSATSGNGPICTQQPLPIPKDLIIDHPFAFEIYESSTGVTLIAGRVNNL